MRRLFTLLFGFFCCATTASAELPPLAQDAWTIAIIPDTQFYCHKDNNAPIFSEITQWLVDQRASRNIQLVIHVGDIVNDNEERQWKHAKNSMSILDGKLPYILSVGNHDLGKNSNNRQTMLNEYFNIGDNPLNKNILGGLFKDGELENAWYRFRYKNFETVIFALEFGPRQDVVTWANGIAQQHPDTPLMLVTHEFIDQESSLKSADGTPQRTTPTTTNNPHKYGISRTDKVHCGEELWQALVSQHPGFQFVFNGHYKAFQKDDQGKLKHLRDLACGIRSDRQKDGTMTHQMLLNAQWAPRGGDGWIRLLEFQPDGKSVHVRTYSPYLARTADDPKAAHRLGPDCDFTLPLGRAASVKK